MVRLPPGPADDDGARRRVRLHRDSDRTLSARHERLFYAGRRAIILLLLYSLWPLWPTRGLANAIGAVNRARAAYCGLSRAEYPPLSESRRLDEIARRLAQGESLEQAELRTGYRAARSLGIQITGPTGDAAVERMVGRQFCSQLAAPQLRQIGAYGRSASGLWIVVAQPFTTPPARDAAAVSRLVLALTNQARAHGWICGMRHFAPAPPLSLSPALTRAALAHSRDMAAHDLFSHAGSDGSSPGERIARAGYRWSIVGENIASGVRTPRAVVAGWLASPHHCANIMTAGFRQMGVAFAVNPASAEVIDWTEDFGTPARPPRTRKPR